MSWSVSFIGAPDNIVAALEKESERLTGPSKDEFDTVKPMLACLVRQNFNNTGYTPMLQLTAHGSATVIEGKPVFGNVGVTLQLVTGTIV